MNIYKEEIKILKANKAKFKLLLKREDIDTKVFNNTQEILGVFTKLETELKDKNSTKRNALILDVIPVFYSCLFLK
jgi:uncharacterized protein YdcH (DUF465 family)